MQPNQPTELDRAFIISGENKITIAAYDPNQRKFLDENIFAGEESLAGKSFILIDTNAIVGQRKIDGIEVGHYTALNFKENDQGKLVAYYTDSIGGNIPDFIKTELEAKGIDVIELKCPRQAEQDCFHHSLFNSLYIKENQSPTIQEIPENAQINYFGGQYNFNEFKDYVDRLDINRDITINVDTNQDITPNAESDNNPNQSKQGSRNYLIVGSVAATAATLLAFYSAYYNNGDNPTPSTDLIPSESGLMRLPPSLIALIHTATGLTPVVAQALQQVQNGLRKVSAVACDKASSANGNCPDVPTPVQKNSDNNATIYIETGASFNPTATTTSSAAAAPTTPVASASAAAVVVEAAAPTTPVASAPAAAAPTSTTTAASNSSAASEAASEAATSFAAATTSAASEAASAAAATSASASAAPTTSSAASSATSSATLSSSVATDYHPTTTPPGQSPESSTSWVIPAIVGAAAGFTLGVGAGVVLRRRTTETTTIVAHGYVSPSGHIDAGLVSIALTPTTTQGPPAAITTPRDTAQASESKSSGVPL